MDYDSLKNSLLNYSTSIKSKQAKVSDFSKIKNDIRAAYDAGAIDKELMKELSDKATFAFKNIGRASELSSVPEIIQESGGKIGQVEGMKSLFSKAADTASDVAKKAEKFGAVKKIMGVAAPIAGVALGSMGVAEKAMAGDGKGALKEAYNTFVPDTVKPTELGNADFNPEDLNDPRIKELQKRVFAGHYVNEPEETTITEEPENNEQKRRALKVMQLMQNK